jgi:protein TonB
VNLFELAKIVACAAVSFGIHASIARGLDALPEPDPPPRPPPVVQVRIDPVEPAKKEPPPEEKPPEPEKKPPPKVVHEAPKPTPAVAHDVVPKDVPPPDHPPVTTDTSNTPVFGVTMESTSQAGGGPAIPVGNTTRATPTQAAKTPGEVKPLAEPVAVYQVTKMPLPQGRCAGAYTDEAKQAGVEGVVVLDIVVGEDGRTRDVNVVQGLSHGLTEAAIAAARACKFSPGERDGTAVPVRIREFKIRFVLDAN